MNWDVLWSILAGGGIGAVLVEVARRKLLSADKAVDAAAALREELREDVSALRGEVRRLQEELDGWRSRYNELLDEYHRVKRELDEVQYEVARLRRIVNENGIEP